MKVLGGVAVDVFKNAKTCLCGHGGAFVRSETTRFSGTKSQSTVNFYDSNAIECFAVFDLA